MNIPKIDFHKSALVPSIIQHYKNNQVLMLGYMNKEALEKTIEEKKITFYSRSKKRLWTKGESSGHYLELVDMVSDCDNDTLLIKAKPHGPTCHTGQVSCFGDGQKGAFLYELEEIIAARKAKPTKGSYTSDLYQKGENKIIQKFGEEAIELLIEAKDNHESLFKNEAADMFFHFLILLQTKGLSLNDIIDVLEERNK